MDANIVDMRTKNLLSLQNLILGLILLLMTGCSSSEIRTTDDPFEVANRPVFIFNDTLDDVVLRPAASIYRKSPNGIQKAVRNHLQWLGKPSDAFNFSLQGDIGNAFYASIHFFVNGLTFGFFDLTGDKFSHPNTDFGLTLAKWNVPQGSYLVLPFLGPNTMRSGVGRIVDGITNPVTLFAPQTLQEANSVAVPLSAVSFRSDNYDNIDAVKKSVDPYARTKSFYYLYRQGQLAQLNIETSNDNDAVFDEFLDEEPDEEIKP